MYIYIYIYIHSISFQQTVILEAIEQLYEDENSSRSWARTVAEPARVPHRPTEGAR